MFNWFKTEEKKVVGYAQTELSKFYNDLYNLSSSIDYYVGTKAKLVAAGLTEEADKLEAKFKKLF